MKKLNIHRDIKTIPIFQYSNLLKTGDLRYLLYLEKSELFNLPEITEFEEINEAYKDLILSLTDINDELQILQINFYKKSIIDVDNSHIYFTKLLDYYNANYKDFKYEGKAYENMYDIRQELKANNSYEDYLNKRVSVFQDLEYKEKSEMDIDETIVILKKAGYVLNKYEDSWNELLVSLKLYGKEIKHNNKSK